MVKSKDWAGVTYSSSVSTEIGEVHCYEGGIMKYKLSFCEIEQLSDNIYEVTINEGAVINENCAKEAERFWHDLRKTPYDLLVNNKNCFSYSFMGARKIGSHPLERKTAVLIDDERPKKEEMSMVINLKKMEENVENRKVFHDRDEAIEWLKS